MPGFADRKPSATAPTSVLCARKGASTFSATGNPTSCAAFPAWPGDTDRPSGMGRPKAASVARDLAERFASASLSAVDGLSVSEQLLTLRQALTGPPTPPPPVAPDPRTPTPAHVAAAFEEAQLEGRRILVVDDQESVTRGLTSILSRRGLIVTALNWDQFISLFGMSIPRFGLALKPEPLPVLYIAVMLTMTALFEILPYLEELARSLVQRNRSLR